MGVHCLTESPSLTLLAICSMIIVFFLPFLFVSLSHTHLFTYFHLISSNPSLYFCAVPLLSSHTYSKLVFPSLELLYSSLPLSVSIPVIININSLSSPTFSFFLFVYFPFHSCLHQFVLIPSHALSFPLPHPLILSWSTFFFFLPLLSHSVSLLSVSFPPYLPQTLSRASTSLCTICVLNAMPSESLRQSVHIAWLSAPSMKTTQR